MHREADDMSDVLAGLDDGIMQGAGVREFDAMKSSRTPEGVAFTFSCDICGGKHKASLDWRELTYMMSNMKKAAFVLPGSAADGWVAPPNRYDNQFGLVCVCNQRKTRFIPVSPTAAAAEVKRGIETGVLHPGQVNAWLQETEQLRQAG